MYKETVKSILLEYKNKSLTGPRIESILARILRISTNNVAVTSLKTNDSVVKTNEKPVIRKEVEAKTVETLQGHKVIVSEVSENKPKKERKNTAIVSIPEGKESTPMKM